MLNKTPNYKVNPMEPGQLNQLIAKKVEDAKKNNQTYEMTHELTKKIEFAQIKMRKDHLYYNLQNDRTLIAVKEFVDEHGKDKDYFDIGNSFNLEQQDNYHKIIHGFISKTMVDEFNRHKEQRFPVYITSEGILTNGNTRMSCWREMDIFDEIDCRVFPAEFSSDWDLMREIVDEQDNAIDIKQEYKWYARAERMARNIDAWPKAKTPSGKINFAHIAQKMKYRTAAEAENNFKMYQLAQEFIATKNFPNYKKVSDLDALGSDSGKQAFETLAKSRKTKETKIHDDILERITRTCFEIMGTDNAGTYKSKHLAIQDQWKNANILRLQKALDQSGNRPIDVLGGEKREKGDEKKFESKPFHGKESDDRKKVLESELKDTKLAIEKEKDKGTKQLFKKKMGRTINQVTETIFILDDTSDLTGIEDLFTLLDNKVDELKNKVKVIKDKK